MSVKSKPTTGVLRPGEVMTLSAFCKVVGWAEHSLRRARREGFRTVTFGRTKYVLTDDAIAFFRRLGEEQGEARP